jgi:hypothetical protein
VTDTIHLLGQGGGVWEMSLPLHPDIAQRSEAAELKRVNEDGTPWRGDQSAKRSRAKATASEMLEGARGDGVRDG